MREKLQTLPLIQLKEIAKSQGMKGVSGMKKAILSIFYARKQKKARERQA